VDNWQAFVPMARGSGDRPEPGAAALAEPAPDMPAEHPANGAAEPAAAPQQEPEPGAPAEPWEEADPWADAPTDPSGDDLADALADLPGGSPGGPPAEPRTDPSAEPSDDLRAELTEDEPAEPPDYLPAEPLTAELPDYPPAEPWDDLPAEPSGGLPTELPGYPPAEPWDDLPPELTAEPPAEPWAEPPAEPWAEPPAAGDELPAAGDELPAQAEGAIPAGAEDELPEEPPEAVPAEAVPSEEDERARVLSLINFLADYGTRKNPPVRDVKRYELFLLTDTGLPRVPGVTLSPAAEAWLTVDFAGPEETAARALHRDLFQQREVLARDRESIELVWGFGRLRWRADGALVDHPLLTVPCEVTLDGGTQGIRVSPAGAPQVEVRCLAGLPLADRDEFMSIGQSVGDAGIDPWDGPALEDVLRRLVRAVDHEGTLAAQAPAPGGAAVADPGWVLFVRRRRPDYLGFLKRMRDLYRDDAVAVPHTLRAIVSAAPSALTEPETDGAGDPGLLLPLPANEGQESILALAQQGTGVTVQGPPGTGKSHTIANIVSHYAAHGKRVLVVAEKEQALRSANEWIPAGIRDLAIPVLGADADSRRELASAIGRIQARVTGIDNDAAGERAERLTSDLEAVDRRIAATTRALLATREAEVDHLPGRWGPVETPTRAEAAPWVAEHAATLGYIDDPLTPAIARPISGGELAEFVTVIAQVGMRRAEACAAVLPKLSAIPPARDLDRHLARLADLRASVRSVGAAVQDWGRVAETGRDVLHDLAGRCRSEMDWMAKTAGTWLSHVRDEAADPLLARDWAAFGAQLSRDREDALALRAVITARGVVIPAVPEPWFLDGLQQARDRLAQTGRLGMFSAPARRALADCRVDGRMPSTAGDIDLCLQAAELSGLRRQMLTRWRQQVGRVGGPDLDEAVPEDVVGPLLENLGDTLLWPEDWARLRGELAAAGIDSPALVDADTLGYLSEVCIRACDQAKVEELSYAVDRLGSWLRSGARSAAGPGSRPVTGRGARTVAPPGPVSPLWNLFADALARQDMRQWHRLREELMELHELAPPARRLREIRTRLSACAPIWTARILADPSAAGDPADFDAAWQWRQLDSWIRDALTGPTPAQLQAELEELSAERGRVVADLVSERAWRALADSLGDRQRQALGSYVQAVTRPATADGRFTQRWLEEIRTALDESKDAIPVWIMPAARALSSFRPEAEPPFDVLVVDEASQIGLEAVPLLALARRAIVIGDDKQTSPENAGLSRQQMFDLLDEHLAAVPEYRTLFDPDGSLYDIALQKFPGAVMLTEHFRCLPPIIAFSNSRAYDGQLIALRDQAPRPGWAALGAVKVLDGCRNGTINEPEANAAVDLVAELCANPDYDGMTMGVISLLGSAQSRLIWEKLYDRVGPEVMTRRDLRSGEPANFQGDERDVVIISTVVAVDPAVPAARVSAMTSNAAMRRINVAASRARQQMWIVHSVDPDRFPDGDLRGALIRHCRDAGTAAEPAGLPDACESQFERDVLGKIMARGYRRVLVQHAVGGYRIDIVIEGPHSRLAVECEGDRWRGRDAWRADRAGQQVLERAGWTFERIRGSAFYRDPDAALVPLWQRLDGLGIPAGDWWPAGPPLSVVREVPGA
jgi:hypothetical protein